MKPELPELVASNIEYFVGRTWLLSHILKWLDESNQRLLILKGAPGTGKSTVLAWLAGTGPLLNDSNAKGQLEKIRSKVKASHFLMSNTGNIAPKAFAESIARQLTQNINQFGQLMINSLDRGRIQINPIQNVGRAQSVVAVNIAKLDLGGLTDEFSFDSVFRAPLKQLYRSGYNETILLLVDALDEAMTYKGGITVVQLLSKLADLPKDVRIIVTTRDDPRVLKNYTDTNIKPFDIIEDAPSTIDDVKSYTSNRLVDLGKRPLRQILAEKVSDGAGGNFLYAHLVINDLLKRLPSLKESKHIEFPTGLGGLYHKFLNRELGVDEDRWFDIFKPLLGLIAIAQGEGLTRNQLERITDQELERTLRICKEYLIGSMPEGPFRLFHKSFADFLLDDKENTDYHIDAIPLHKRIVNYYKDNKDSWKDVDWKYVDDYGLRYLSIHAYELRDVKGFNHQLYDLICEPAKLWKFDSPKFFLEDIALAIQAAHDDKTT